MTVEMLSYDTLGRQIEARDAAGTTTFLYDFVGSLINETVRSDDALVVATNTIDRFYDTFGRDVGYALNGARQSTLAYDPATGRLATMFAAGSDTPFAWSYMPGSDLKSLLAYPNGLTASWQYDANNLLLQVCNAFPTNTISQYDYAYDAAGRRVACGKSGSAFTQNDTLSYGYNEKSELTNAVAEIDSDYRYAYRFDDIGNRETSSECGTNTCYSANALNQYTSISNLCDSASLREEFHPHFDDDGNQTLVKTATGIWQVQYNGENRPIHFVNGDMVVTMIYDCAGRRVENVESVGLTTSKRQTFVYDNYLCIGRMRDNLVDYFTWDPTEKIQTHLLCWQSRNHITSDVRSLYYTHDGRKCVSEVVRIMQGEVAAHYEYSPFGISKVNVVSKQDDYAALIMLNPWLMSCEYYDARIGLVYFNYRHYNPREGRWVVRDFMPEIRTLNLYGFTSIVIAPDILGLVRFTDSDCNKVKPQCQKAIGKIRATIEEYLGKAGESPDEWYRKASAAYANHMPQGWGNADRFLDSLKELLKYLEDGNGPEVTCCTTNDKDMRDMCRNAASGYVRDSRSRLYDHIIMCPEGLNNSETYGGCGCLILHELLHKLGFKTTQQDPPTDGDINKASKEYVRTYIRNRDTENGMVRLARHLLKMNKEFKCNGYDIFGPSDEDQIWGPSDNNLW